jgi:hypothetical protein
MSTSDHALEAEALTYTMTLFPYDPPVISRIANQLRAIVGEIARPKRQRKPSIAVLIRQARKAGERGPVRVTLLDGTSITSQSEAVAEQMTQAGGDDWRGLQ